MSRKWEIEISDARGAWGCKGFRAPGPGIYVTDDLFVAELASTYEHIYVRELGVEEKVEHEGPAESPVPTEGPLTVQDLRASKPQMQTCTVCYREYKFSHKRCLGPPDDVAVEDEEAPSDEASKSAPESEVRIIPIGTTSESGSEE